MSSWFLTLLWPKGESSIRKVTISDHFLDFTDNNLKSPKQAPTYVVTHSFCNYKADQFATDITHIPSDTVNLRDSVDDRLDSFNAWKTMPLLEQWKYDTNQIHLSQGA